MTDSESYEDYIDSRVPRWISLVLFFIGIFGNLASFIVFNRMKKNSTFIYLSILCIVDVFVLFFGLGDIILLWYFRFVIRNQSLFLCRIHTFFTFACTHLSSFILASVSIDRAIATNAINLAKKYCNPSTAFKVTIINIIFAIIINFHSLIFLGYETLEPPSSSNLTLLNYINASTSSTESYVLTCGSEIGSLYDNFLDPYFEFFDLLFYAILPFIIMAICTFLIIRILLKSNKRLNKTKARKSLKEIKATSNDDISQNRVILIERTPNKILKSNLSKKPKKTKSRKSKTMHLTYTLISINTLFFCLVSPLVIVYIIIIMGKQSIEKILF